MTPLPTKQEIRIQMRTQRRTVSAAERLEAARALYHQALHASPVMQYQEIAGYVPTADEIDIMPIIATIAAKGGRICLPFIDETNQMVFHRWQIGQPLKEGKFGIPTPSDGEVVIPQLILLPLLACDVQGVRLGMGGGYYDRTLSDPAYAESYLLGVGYQFQLLQHLPSEPQDVRVHGFLSEAGFHDCRRA